MDKQIIHLVRSDAPIMSNDETLKFSLVDNSPIVEGEIDGQPAKILLNTGDRSNLTLFRKFARAARLEDLFARRNAMLTGMGVGGPIRGKLASLQKVNLGSTEVTDVLARLPLTQHGYFIRTKFRQARAWGCLRLLIWNSITKIRS